MRAPHMTWVFIGLSITSSWGNGHATTYRALLSALRRRGHRIIFLERATPWYRDNADMPDPPFCQTVIYESAAELYRKSAALIESADACIVGSYVPDGATIAEFVTRTCRGVTAFYDIDTPVTLRELSARTCTYLTCDNIPEFDVYLSFTGGPTLERLCSEYGARRAVPLYCSVDPYLYYPVQSAERWAMGYLGTFSDDRQPVLDRLLCNVARELPNERFVVAGPQYPNTICWPGNVERMTHVSPRNHCQFYGTQRVTLNVTRQDMVQAGHAPSVRLFEAAACGVPIISDIWPGIESFFVPESEILLAETTEDVIRHVTTLTPKRRELIGDRALARVLREHTASHRAAFLESLVGELRARKSVPASKTRSRAPGDYSLSSEAGE